MAGRRWTKREDARLADMVGRLRYRAIAEILRRSRRACEIRATILGVATRRGSEEWCARVSAANRGKRRNPAGEFKKGNVPWNRGMKGLHLSPATEFKKGCLNGRARQRYRPVGMIKVRKHKGGGHHRWIKLRDDGRPSQRWVPLARHLWEQAHGTVPVGCFVVHRDGDTMNDALENLLPMDRAHLPAWQQTVRPEMEARRKAASAKGQVKGGRTRALLWRIRRARRKTEQRYELLRRGA